jgi:hypothetical protein
MTLELVAGMLYLLRPNRGRLLQSCDASSGKVTGILALLEEFRLSRRAACTGLLLLPLTHVGAASRSRFAGVRIGLDAAGYPTPRWISAIAGRVDDAELARIRKTPCPLSSEDNAWVEAVRRIGQNWSARLPELDAPFRGLAKPPRRPFVLLGNQGGDDGFTSGADAIAMDLRSLQQAYGGPSASDSENMICRLLSHEYSHLLIRPWLDRCGWSEQWAARKPYLRALRTLYNEGIAGLRSIEDPRWTSSEGVLTSLARDTLATLQPRMVERLTALAENPPPDVARGLLRNISQGRLADKWGSMPIALWLAQASRLNSARLGYFASQKPDAILQLAAEQADPAYRPAFAHLQEIATAQIAAARAERH